MNEFALMIADDEKIIRDGLCGSIDWTALGFRIAAVASDGEEALRLFREAKPDAVIMDIRMPGMDGLEVLEAFKSERPETEVILLSGYDEFAYAKKGLREGAFDYIIKLHMFTELENCLRRLHQALTLKRAESERYSHLLKLRNDLMFQEFIKGRRPAEPDRAPGGTKYGVVSVWIPPGAARSADWPVRSSFSLPHFVGRTGDALHFIFYTEGEDSQPFPKRLADAAGKLEHALDSGGAGAYRMGVGTVKSSVEDIPGSYREAMKAVDYLRHRDAGIPQRSVLFYADWPGQDISALYRMSSLAGWVNWVYSGDEASLTAWIGTVFEEAYANKKITVADMKYLCLQIAAQFEKVTQQKESDELLLHELDSLKDLEEQFIGLVKARSRVVHERIQQQKNESISAVKDYVDQMYTTNLRLEEVAQRFYFSPGYLSAKFKEYTGQSFSQYVIGKRIETACRLLAGTDMKIYEIAQQVGYSDEKHFSKLFTQLKKIGPREYRKRGRG